MCLVEKNSIFISTTLTITTIIDLNIKLFFLKIIYQIREEEEEKKNKIEANHHQNAIFHLFLIPEFLLYVCLFHSQLDFHPPFVIEPF